jgi:hypothetical protein
MRFVARLLLGLFLAHAVVWLLALLVLGYSPERTFILRHILG